MNTWKITPLEHAPTNWLQTWDALNARLCGAHPMLDSRFVAALLAHFGTPDVHLCWHETDGNPDAACLLRRHRIGMWTTFLPAQMQIGTTLIGDWGAIPELVRSLPGLKLSLDLLCQDPNFGFPAARFANKRATHLLSHALTMDIRLSGTFDAYWASRSRKLVNNMRRYANRWRNLGESPRFVRITRPDEMVSAITRYGNLELSGWKGEAGTAIHIDNAQGRFYVDVMQSFARTGNGLVYEYWLGDTLAAARLAISSHKSIVMLKTAYDESLADLAPGRLLLHDLLRGEWDSLPGGTIEFYTNATQDQLAWATGQRPIQHVTFYRNSAARGLISVIRHANKLLPSNHGA